MLTGRENPDSPGNFDAAFDVVDGMSRCRCPVPETAQFSGLPYCSSIALRTLLINGFSLLNSASLLHQVASNEHDEQEVLVQSLCAFLLGLCVVYNNDSNTSFTKVLIYHFIF